MTPADDRALSPYTGFTRAHWEATADQLLAAVRPFATPGGAQFNLPGPASRSSPSSDGLEGYARTFLLAAFRSVHAPAAHAETILRPYAEGLAAGTDPDSPERWPLPSQLGQARVEAASIALGLALTRPLLWDRLPDAVAGRAADWLGDIAGNEVPDCNWVWFRAVVAAFLRSIGAPYSAADIAYAIESTDDWYRGGGWYTDGPVRDFDHYNAWAMHFYPLWYSRISGDTEPLDRYRERLTAFLDDAQHLIGADGAPLFQGRSLTYRFAAAAPFWTGALFDAGPLPPGRTRRAASGMLRYFLDRGATAEGGLLSIGWHGSFERVRQHYSGPASPYWASKGFAGLLLPPDHPVWTAREEPLPVEQGDFTRLVAAPGWLATGTAADGVIRVVNHGADHAQPGRPRRDDPFYARHAYTTHTAPDLREPDLTALFGRDGDARLGDNGPDGLVALLDPSGAPSHRTPFDLVALAGRTAVSRHRAHWPATGETGPWVTSASVVNGPWEVRLVDVAGEGHRVRIGGHALADAAPPAGKDLGISTRADGLTTALLVLHPAPGAALMLHRAEHANPYGRHSATPVYDATGPRHAVAVFLGRTDGTLPPPPAVDLAGTTATVTWPDGTADTVPIDASPSA